MKFEDVAARIGTLTDLRRIAGAHVVDHRRRQHAVGNDDFRIVERANPGAPNSHGFYAAFDITHHDPVANFEGSVVQYRDRTEQVA